MRHHLVTAILLGATALPLAAELTPAQRRQDFIELATLYWKQYGPYEWKRELFGHDLADLRPWLTRVDAAKTDMDFAEVCAEYTNALRDGHVFFQIPSRFQATGGIGVDVYEGKVLVEGFNAVLLPPAQFPLRIGDEVVSFDGKPAMEEVNALRRLVGSGSTLRYQDHIASNYLFFRPQGIFPNAPQLGDGVDIVIRHADGSTDNLRIPWVKTGEPLKDFGNMPPLRLAGKVKNMLATNPVRLPEDVNAEPWLRSLYELGHSAAPEHVGLQGYGAASPVWAPPAGFVQRLTPNDFFVSGTYNGEYPHSALCNRVRRCSPVHL